MSEKEIKNYIKYLFEKLDLDFNGYLALKKLEQELIDKNNGKKN